MNRRLDQRGERNTAAPGRAGSIQGVDWVDIAVEEYRTLRSESLGAIEQAQRSLQLGLAAIAAITAFASDGKGIGTLEIVAVAVAGPLVATLVTVLWLLELKRAVFAGSHIAELEQRINAAFPDRGRALTWESDVQERFTRKGAYTFDRAVVLTLFATTVPSVVVGIGRLHRHHHPAWIAGVVVFVVGLLAVSLGHQWRVNRTMAARRQQAKAVIAAGPGA